jgi:hypothetical protein
VYYILIGGSFTYWGNTYDSINSYKDKTWVYLDTIDPKTWMCSHIEWASYRGTWNGATFNCTAISTYPKGTKLIPLVWRACNSWTYNCFVACTFRIVKLW